MLEWNKKRVPVTGVIADFHDGSLKNPIKPLLISGRLSEENCMNVLLQSQASGIPDWKGTLSKIEATYKDLYPEETFTCNFLDESIARFYKKEQDISFLLNWATGLAITISCMGLLGLAIYTTGTRTKQIGVRKVLGASVVQIIGILSKDFIILVLMGFVIALPVAWWGTQKWLENFSYKTTMNWWLFAAAGAGMLAIALITLAFQVIQAAIANPVKSLRSE